AREPAPCPVHEGFIGWPARTGCPLAPRGVASKHGPRGDAGPRGRTIAMPTPQENEATTRELIQKVMNEGDIGFAEKTLSEDYVERTPMPGGTPDKAGALAMFKMMRATDTANLTKQ